MEHHFSKRDRCSQRKGFSLFFRLCAVIIFKPLTFQKLVDVPLLARSHVACVSSPRKKNSNSYPALSSCSSLAISERPLWAFFSGAAAARHAGDDLRGAFQYGCLHVPQGSGPGADSGSLWHAFRCVDGAHLRGVRVASLHIEREPGTMGAMLAASDPVPVLTGMTVSGADCRLITLTSAESIINDGPGVLLFSPFRRGGCGGRGHSRWRACVVHCPEHARCCAPLLVLPPSSPS